MTRLEEAVRAVLRAAGDRPIVVIWDPTHQGPGSRAQSLYVAAPSAHRMYVTVGMLREAENEVRFQTNALVERMQGPMPTDPPPSDEE